MVARIRTGKSIKGAINYNEHKVKEEKARLLFATGYSKDITRMHFVDKWKRLQNLADLNTRAATNCVHISLNFDPSEKLTVDLLKTIAQEYMEGLGFGGQPFLVYQHMDAAHPHLHIVTTNIQRDGQRISLHNLGKMKSEPTRKSLELKFDLVKADSKRRAVAEKTTFSELSAANYGKSATKKTITNIVTSVIEQYKFSSLAELNAVLRPLNVIATRGKEGTRMFEKNGLQYSLLDKNGVMVGVPIKASNIYGSPTLANLKHKFEEGDKSKNLLKRQLRESVTACLQEGKSLQSFSKKLSETGIELVLRKNADRFIYGVTYIDRRNKAVFNGSDLGKEFSAAAIRLLHDAPVPADRPLLIQPRIGTAEINPAILTSENKAVQQDSIVLVAADKMPYDFVPYELSMRKKRKRKRGKQ